MGKVIFNELFAFVIGIWHRGVITAHEAESILHTMREHMAKSQQVIQKANLGYVTKAYHQITSEDEDEASCRKLGNDSEDMAEWSPVVPTSPNSNVDMVMFPNDDTMDEQ